MKHKLSFLLALSAIIFTLCLVYVAFYDQYITNSQYLLSTLRNQEIR